MKFSKTYKASFSKSPSEIPKSDLKLFIVVLLALVFANFLAYAFAVAYAFNEGSESLLFSLAGRIASAFSSPCIFTRDYLVPSSSMLYGKFNDLIAFTVTTLAESLLIFYPLRWLRRKLQVRKLGRG